ncbi:MAG: restriction endonuclease subunit S, partial [Salibaculum sp.]|uniref:restriction endonuclease subunit S n=1 Tax=Salibaculum sp. TaxID=2855480 RepID=UPI0028706CFB
MYQPKTIGKKDMQADGAYPVFGANGIIGRYHAYNHEEPQLVVGCRGACGSVHMTEPFSWITGNTMVIQPKSASVDLRFLEYFFRGPVDIASAVTGAAQPQITQTSLKPIQVPLPPLEEQKRIVAKLDQAFAALDRARAHAEANLADANSLFDSWIDTAFRFGIAEWPTKRLPEICENLDRRRVPITKADRLQGDVPYYGATGVVDYVAEHIFDEDLLLVSEDGANLLARTYPIAFSISGRAWVNNHA